MEEDKIYSPLNECEEEIEEVFEYLFTIWQVREEIKKNYLYLQITEKMLVQRYIELIVAYVKPVFKEIKEGKEHIGWKFDEKKEKEIKENKDAFCFIKTKRKYEVSHIKCFELFLEKYNDFRNKRLGHYNSFDVSKMRVDKKDIKESYLRIFTLGAISFDNSSLYSSIKAFLIAGEFDAEKPYFYLCKFSKEDKKKIQEGEIKIKADNLIKIWRGFNYD